MTTTATPAGGLYASLAVEGFAHARTVERALEGILAQRFRVSFGVKETRADRIIAPEGMRGIVISDARTAMLVQLDYEASYPPALGVCVEPALVSAALRVFEGGRTHFLKAADKSDSPLIVQQEGSSFAVVLSHRGD